MTDSANNGNISTFNRQKIAFKLYQDPILVQKITWRTLFLLENLGQFFRKLVNMSGEKGGRDGRAALKVERRKNLKQP